MARCQCCRKMIKKNEPKLKGTVRFIRKNPSNYDHRKNDKVWCKSPYCVNHYTKYGHEEKKVDW